MPNRTPEPRAPDNAALMRAAQRLRVDQVAAETIAASDAAGVESILLKGASFAELLYPEGGRSYGDVDLLVRRRDVRRAARVLNDLGYADGQEGYAAVERNTEASTFVHRDPLRPITVDLHVNLHWLPDPDRTWRVLQQETEAMKLGTLRVTTLNVAARAMLVALHASHHGLLGPAKHDRGGQTGEDLRRALRIVDAADWRKAQHIAAQIGGGEAFEFGLRLDADGAALADALGLRGDEVTDLWALRAPFHESHARGALTLHRLGTTPTRREQVAVVARWLVPSRARVRAVADSRVGQASLPGAYLEYWLDAARALPAGLRSGRHLPRDHG